MPLKPSQRRIIMGDLLGISARAQAAGKAAKALRLLIEEAEEGMFSAPVDAENTMDEIETMLFEAKIMADAVDGALRKADMIRPAYAKDSEQPDNN